jgi:hypothetical protein
VLCFIEDCRVAGAVVPATASANDHTAFETSQYGASYNSGPRVYRMVYLDGLRCAQCDGMCRSLGVRWGRRCVEMCLHAVV